MGQLAPSLVRLSYYSHSLFQVPSPLTRETAAVLPPGGTALHSANTTQPPPPHHLHPDQLHFQHGAPEGGKDGGGGGGGNNIEHEGDHIIGIGGISPSPLLDQPNERHEIEAKERQVWEVSKCDVALQKSTRDWWWIYTRSSKTRLVGLLRGSFSCSVLPRFALSLTSLVLRYSAHYPC